MARLRGLLWLTAGVVVALLAGVVAFATLSRAAEAPASDAAETPKVSVVVASRPVEVRALLTAEDVEVQEMPVDNVPEGAVREPDAAIGRLTLVDLYPGEVIVAQRLVDPNVIAPNGRLALTMVEDQVLMAIPAQDLLSRIGVLKPGDHVDLLFSLDFPADRSAQAGTQNSDEEQATFSLLENVTVAALVAEQAAAGAAAEKVASTTGQPRAILLTIDPQDALAVKYMIDAGGTFDLVLRAPGVDRLFDTQPVDVDYLINRYNIPTEAGR